MSTVGPKTFHFTPVGVGLASKLLYCSAGSRAKTSNLGGSRIGDLPESCSLRLRIAASIGPPTSASKVRPSAQRGSGRLRAWRPEHEKA